jgi:outer membrane protein TolC
MGFIRLTRLVSTLALVLCMNAFGEVLTLEQMRSEVLSNNIDIKLQYEKYYQSQKNVSVKFGEFLPNLNFNVLYAPTTAAILQSIIPTPSDWFVYQASKDLKVAEEYTSQSLRLNILEGLTNTYINIKIQQEILVSLENQTEILNETYEAASSSENMGFGSPVTTFEAKRALLKHEQQIFVLKALIAAQKEALLLALSRVPTADLELAQLPEDNYELPETTEEATEIALERSTELMSNTYLKQASLRMIQSQRYSFLSFNGIGFDYPALLSIESSKSEVVSLQREQLEIKIMNQVYAAYEELDLIEQRIELQEQQLDISEQILYSSTQMFEGGQITKEKLSKAQVEVLSEERTMLTLLMEKRVVINNIKRLLSADATLLDNNTPQTSSSVEVIVNISNKNVQLSVRSIGELNNSIVSVKYEVESFKRPSRSTDSSSDFLSIYKFRRNGVYNVTATITLSSGQTIVETTQIKL